MTTNTIISLLQDYQNDSAEACEQILECMMPLVKTYAGKIHCMDHEDAIQELQLSILEALPYLNPKNGAGKCISYIEKSVIHRYYALCKRYLSIPASESIEDHDASLPTVPAYDDTLLDIEAYIRTLPKSGGKQQIFSYFFYEDLSDKEIAERMHLSRQYVNRGGLLDGIIDAPDQRRIFFQHICGLSRGIAFCSLAHDQAD